MGINIHTLKMFFEMCDLLEIKSFEGLNICGLGNLKLRGNTRSFLESKNIQFHRISREFFEHLGFNSISIDINGCNGSLPLDLSKPIQDKKLIGKFDFLINGGTSEHVYEQYEFWYNSHILCRENALMLTITPFTNNWKNHAYWTYSLEFFDYLSSTCNYDILERKIVNFKEKSGYDCCYIALKKLKNNDFVSRKNFIKNWNLTQPQKYGENNT